MKKKKRKKLPPSEMIDRYSDLLLNKYLLEKNSLKISESNESLDIVK